MSISFFKQTNPLIDECSAETLANVQAMLARIQILRIDNRAQQKNTQFPTKKQGINSTPCPGNELYGRLLMLVKEAIDYEIERINES